MEGVGGIKIFFSTKGEKIYAKKFVWIKRKQLTLGVEKQTQFFRIQLTSLSEKSSSLAVCTTLCCLTGNSRLFKDCSDRFLWQSRGNGARKYDYADTGPAGCFPERHSTSPDPLPRFNTF
jgi:hypothetical protein